MTSIEDILHNWPIVQIVHSFFVLCAMPLVMILMYFLRKVALHVNSKFLLHSWLLAFFISILAHASFIICDLQSGKYIPESDNDPEYRLIIFGVHGFVHAFSSVQELFFSMERTFACANPTVYHDRSLSITPLFFSEVAAFLVITKIWTDRKMRNLLLSGLNEKYQIKEAFEITKVMLPCGLISLIMKLCAMSLGWIYGLHLIQSRYAFTITSGLYFIIESANCIICSVIFLTTHPKLRRSISLILCLQHSRTSELTIQCRNNLETHFDSLKNEWKTI